MSIFVTTLTGNKKYTNKYWREHRQQVGPLKENGTFKLQVFDQNDRLLFEADDVLSYSVVQGDK